jgi:hypothetical protein
MVSTSAHALTMKFNRKGAIMIDLKPSRNLAARRRAGCYLFLLAGLLAVMTPLRADNPPTYLFEIDASAVSGGFDVKEVFV